MKAYKVTVLVVDHDELGGDEIKAVMEALRYPSNCISPEVMAIEERDIGEWKDDHPLNFQDQTEEAYRQLFGGKVELRQLKEEEILFTFAPDTRGNGITVTASWRSFQGSATDETSQFYGYEQLTKSALYRKLKTEAMASLQLSIRLAHENLRDLEVSDGS